MDKRIVQTGFTILLLLTFCYSCGPTAATVSVTPPPTAVIQPTATVAVRSTPTMAVQPTPLAVLWSAHIRWQEVAFAGASVDDLLRVAGTPNQIQSYREGQVYQYWPDAGRNTFINVTLIEDVVQLVSVVSWPGTSLGQTPAVLTGREGQALVVYEDYGVRGSTVYAFPAEGFAIEVEGEKVTVVQYFVPTDEATYLSRWGKRHPRQVLFPSPTDVLLDMLVERGVAIGQTRAEVERVLGQGYSFSVSTDSCQRMRYRLRSNDRIWRFEIDILYSNQNVAIIDTTWFRDDTMTFADIVREYGIPDLVLGDPNDFRSQGYLMTLVYLSAGIQFTIGGMESYTGEEFGGEGVVNEIALFDYGSTKEYFADPCGRLWWYLGSYVSDPQAHIIPWEVANPFEQ